VSIFVVLRVTSPLSLFDHSLTCRLPHPRLPLCRFLFWFLYQRILDAAADLWDLIGVVNHTTDMTASTETVTFTVSAADAYWVRSALNDSAIRWMDLWRDAMAGERPDLDADSCRSINRRALRLYEDLSEQEMRQSA